MGPEIVHSPWLPSGTGGWWTHSEISEDQHVSWEPQEVVRGVWITTGFLASYPDLFSPLYQYLLIYFPLVIRLISYCLSFSLSPKIERSGSFVHVHVSTKQWLANNRYIDVPLNEWVNADSALPFPTTYESTRYCEDCRTVQAKHTLTIMYDTTSVFKKRPPILAHILIETRRIQSGVNQC